ncbi:restriction endonuclease subunit S [Staphylococcus xylosus]|uniref:restriction endonuclease subunit S n=1 Tax=Staphylococcus xylosus TaxID=1288 RepID=UPI000344EBB2|nr:restriction endonuclease subunit S [Staphylococcus xylosus]
MTNETKNVPELRFPEFSEKWSINIFGDVVTNKSSKYTPKKTETLIDIELDSIESNTGRLIKNYTSNDFSSQKNVFKQNQVLYSKLRPYLNKYYFPNFDGVCTSEIWVLDSKYSSTLSNEFLYYFIQTNKFKEVTNKSSGSKMPRADWNLVGNMRFNITSLKEQQKIGNFFSKLDRQIELEEQKLEKLEEQKKGYMQQIFSQELRFKDDNGNEYPRWRETSIRNTFDNKGGTALEKEFDNNGTHKVISIGSYSMNSTYNEQNLRIKKNKFTENYLLNEGDLAMVLNDKTKEGNIIGRSIYIDENDKYIYNQRTERLIPNNSNNNKFLWYLMNSEQVRNKIKRMMQGATQVYINYNSIKDLNIYLPVLEEQNKIENFLRDIFKLIKNQSDKVELLKERKKGFLQKMFV